MPLKCFVRYVLPNGKKIAGYYDDFTRKLSGLQPMSHLLGDSHLNSINMLLVTYESGGHLTISFFADDFVKVFFYVYVLLQFLVNLLLLWRVVSGLRFNLLCF